jgi:hypothetical protein
MVSASNHSTWLYFSSAIYRSGAPSKPEPKAFVMYALNQSLENI